MNARKLGCGIAAGCLLASAAAFPVTTTTQNFQVKLTITPECVVGAGSDIDFGSSGYLDTNVDAAGSIMVGCTEGTQPTITLNNGANSASCGGARCMKSPTTGDFVKYDLYVDNGRATAWPALGVSGPAGSGAVSGGAGSADQTVNIYGRVPPQATPTPASDYVDTVTATVAF